MRFPERPVGFGQQQCFTGFATVGRHNPRRRVDDNRHVKPGRRLRPVNPGFRPRVPYLGQQQAHGCAFVAMNSNPSSTRRKLSVIFGKPSSTSTSARNMWIPRLQHHAHLPCALELAQFDRTLSVWRFQTGQRLRFQPVVTVGKKMDGGGVHKLMAGGRVWWSRHWVCGFFHCGWSFFKFFLLIIRDWIIGRAFQTGWKFAEGGRLCAFCGVKFCLS